MVGNDVGGLLAWTVAAQHPQVVRRIAVLGAAHPLRLRQAVLDDGGQRRAARYALRTFQVPGSASGCSPRTPAYPAAAVRHLVRGALADHPQLPDRGRAVRGGDRIRWRTARWSSSAGGSGRCPDRTAGPTPRRCAPDHPAGAAAARRGRPCVLAGHRAGFVPARLGRLRVAAAARRGPLSAAREPGAGLRRADPVGQARLTRTAERTPAAADEQALGVVTREVVDGVAA